MKKKTCVPRRWLLVLFCVFCASVLVRRYHVGKKRPEHQLATSTELRPVWWHAPFLTGTGYATEALGFAIALQRAGLMAPGKLWLSQHCGLVKMEVLAGMEESVRADLLELLYLGYGSAPLKDRSAIIICHSIPGCWSTPDPPQNVEGSYCPQYPASEASYVIGRTMWETDRLPLREVERLNQMHEIWVPCTHNKEVYLKSGVIYPQLVVMPGTVDTDFFDPTKHMPLPLPIGRRAFGGEYTGHRAQRPFVFLSIFDWIERKGWDTLLHAYLEEFSREPKENVVLVILTKPNAFLADSDFVLTMRKWAAANLPDSGDIEALPSVYVEYQHIAGKDLPRLYKAADAFVHPTRGEGWGRPHVEAMSMGLPVIATNWSGLTDFLDESVGYPIAVERLIPVPPGVPVYSEGEQRWAQPSVQHLRELMRRVINNPTEAIAKGRAARMRMLERYTPEVVARLVASRLQVINEQLRHGDATAVAGGWEDSLA